MVPCWVSREADEQEECSVWQGNLESSVPNGLVRYHDATANFSLPTDLATYAAQHHEAAEGPPGSTPL